MSLLSLFSGKPPLKPAERASLEAAVARCATKGKFEELRRICRRLDREPTQQEIGACALVLMHSGSLPALVSPGGAMDLCRMGVSADVVETLVGVYLADGMIENAAEAAALNKRTLTSDELEPMLAVARERRDAYLYRRVMDALGRDYTMEDELAFYEGTPS